MVLYISAKLFYIHHQPMVNQGNWNLFTLSPLCNLSYYIDVRSECLLNNVRHFIWFIQTFINTIYIGTFTFCVSSINFNMCYCKAFRKKCRIYLWMVIYKRTSKALFNQSYYKSITFLKNQHFEKNNFCRQLFGKIRCLKKYTSVIFESER